MSRLESLDGTSWEDLWSAPLAVLVLGKSDCANCSAWSEELSSRLDGDAGFYPEVRFGKLLLDQPGLVSFKRANPWIAQLDVLPFNLILQGGERKKEFAGSGLERLENRLKRFAGASGS